MISFKVQGEDISPASVWYHSQKINKTDSCYYEIEILNERDLIRSLESSFGIGINDKLFSEKMLKADESHFNIVTMIIRFLIKDKNYPREDIQWVFNTVEKVFIEGDKLKISGIASKYIPDDPDR